MIGAKNTIIPRAPTGPGARADARLTDLMYLEGGEKIVLLCSILFL